MEEGHRIVISTIFCGVCGWIMMPTESGFFECHNATCENCLKQWRIVQIIMERVQNLMESKIPGVRA